MFTQEEYEAEIKYGLLLIADHISRMRDQETAAAFIGFVSDDYSKESPEKVDLFLFQFGLQVLLMYNFAFGIGGLGPSGDFEESALASFVALVPRTNGYGDPVPWPEDPLSQKVLDAYRARQKLDDPTLRQDAVFSVRELALLADMTEGAVRNAMSGKGELKPQRRDDKVVVDWPTAVGWLSKKRGFRPTPGEDASTFPWTLEIAVSLAEFLGTLNTLDGAGDALPTSWKEGQWTGDLKESLQVAKVLGLDTTRFLTKLTQLWIAEHLLGSE